MKSMLLVALVPAIALAQKPPAACPLLTDAEISAATGMKVGKGQQFAVPALIHQIADALIHRYPS